jgi:nitroreductase
MREGGHMELAAAMTTTGASRAFADVPVDDQTIRIILDRARFAPSGGNRQPWRVVVVRDPRLRAEVASAYEEGWREYAAHVRAGLIPFAPGDDGIWHGPAIDLEAARATPAENPLADALARSGTLLLLFARLPDLAVLDNGLGRQSIVGGASIYPFAQNILLAARDLGLGGVLTSVVCRQEARLRPLVGADETLAIAGLIVLGVPVAPRRRLRRRPVEEFAFVDRLGGQPLGPPAGDSAAAAPDRPGLNRTASP